jgi:hypothetical protein
MGLAPEACVGHREADDLGGARFQEPYVGPYLAVRGAGIVQRGITSGRAGLGEVVVGCGVGHEFGAGPRRAWKRGALDVAIGGLPLAKRLWAVLDREVLITRRRPALVPEQVVVTIDVAVVAFGHDVDPVARFSANAVRQDENVVPDIHIVGHGGGSYRGGVPHRHVGSGVWGIWDGGPSADASAIGVPPTLVAPWW